MHFVRLYNIYNYETVYCTVQWNDWEKQEERSTTDGCCCIGAGRHVHSPSGSTFCVKWCHSMMAAILKVWCRQIESPTPSIVTDPSRSEWLTSDPRVTGQSFWDPAASLMFLYQMQWTWHSHSLAESEAMCRVARPPSNLLSGQSFMMCAIDWVSSPQMHSGLSEW